jgi:hypothetical protein
MPPRSHRASTTSAPRGAVFIGELGLGGKSGPFRNRRRLASAQLGMSVAFVGARGLTTRNGGPCVFRLTNTWAALFATLFRS